MALLRKLTLFELERVTWLDSDLVRLKTGGVTIDSASVPAGADGRKVLKAGYPIALDANTGKYRPSIPAFASLVTGTVEAKTAILWRAKQVGPEGNNISVTIAVPSGANQSLTVSVDGTDITVSVATDDGGNPASTAADVVNAVNADFLAASLVVASLYGEGNDGSGVVTGVSKTNLTGGATAEFLLFEDVDVTNGDAEAAAMDWGRVKASALPVQVDEAMRAALPGITFA